MNEDQGPCSRLENAIKMCDMFRFNFNMKIQGSKEHRETLLGAILTILITIWGVTYAGFKLKILYWREDTTIIRRDQ